MSLEGKRTMMVCPVCGEQAECPGDGEGACCSYCLLGKVKIVKLKPVTIPHQHPYMDQWLAIGQKNPWIREACDPPFGEEMFHECKDDNELLDRFAHGNWCLGQAYWIGDLAFIQQVDGGDEWLTIKQGLDFESISFGYIIHKGGGRPAAQAILDGIRASTLDQCRRLKYMKEDHQPGEGGPG